MKHIIAMLLGVLWFSLVQAGQPDSLLGLWQAFNDKGEPTGYIRISEQDGVFKGTVERGLPTDKEEKYCTACKGERQNQRLMGMDILWGLRKQGNDYGGGEILDPFSGEIASARLRMLEGAAKLKLRGYKGLEMFGRTQIWKREE